MYNKSIPKNEEKLRERNANHFSKKNEQMNKYLTSASECISRVPFSVTSAKLSTNWNREKSLETQCKNYKSSF